MRKASALLMPSDYDIWYYYFGFIPNLENFFKSPFREDKSAGCKFFVRDNKLFFNDFGGGRVYSTISAVMKKLDVPYRKARELIRKVPRQVPADRVIYEQKKKVITFITKPLNDEYFSRYHISRDTLLKYKVCSVKRLYVNDKVYWKSSKNNPIYHYALSQGHKFYRPLAVQRHKKWLSSGNGIFGLHELPTTSKICFITSSAKEVLLLSELGFNAIALQSESIGKPSSKNYKKVSVIASHLKRRFDNVYTLFDYDDTGLKSMHICKEDFEVDGGTTGKEHFKDLSDYCEHYGLKRTFKLLKKLIKKLSYDKIN